jgi:CDGSH-type Zn-finger protein
VLGEPRVFLANVVGPWLHPDATSAEALTQVAHACPSGAITYRRLDGGPEERAPLVNLLRVRENGPLALHAELVVAGKKDGHRATLCRCGASQNKPYCDGSHNAIAFRASGEPLTQESSALAARDGELIVEPRRNGPLALSGNLELCSGTGRTIGRTTRALLCRCGGSANKPYCDGTHARNGFQAE